MQPCADMGGSLAQRMADWDGLGEDALARLKAALTDGQGTRLLQIETSLAAGAFVVEQVRLTEAVHADEPLWAEVDCVSTCASLSLKAVMGEPAALKLQLADGQWRTWHGHVVQATQLGADGGLARYRLTLAAWTHWLRHRIDARIFQDLTAQDVITRVCSAYPQAHFRFEASSPGPVRAITTQYRESDWDFVKRLMASEGWSWRLEHHQVQADRTEPAGPKHSRHGLVIFDASAALPDLGVLAFSRPDIRQDAQGFTKDTVTQWRTGQQVGTSAVTLAAWDERQLASVAAQSGLHEPSEHLPHLEHYEGHGERRHADARIGAAQSANQSVAQSRADARMAAHALHHHLVEGDSAVRAFREGARFALSGHSLYPDAAPAFALLSVTHEAANNLGAQAAEILQRSELVRGAYRNQFEAAPAALRLAPRPQAAPVAPGLMTATVVAAPEQPLSTDRDQRIRVQFAWQRGLQALRGGLVAPLTPAGQDTGHAPGTDSSGTWVRVAQASAGANWGSVFTPRAGSEVLVEFVDGDIDRPLVVGSLHHGQNDPPWPAGEGSGANHLGTLAGWHSQHLDGQGANQWVMDDATGQLRMRLASHSAATGWSELSLGRIIQQSGQGGAGHAQRGTWLGEGFYGHTDGWAMVRAGQGLLLSTTARAAQGASVASTQMDAAEAVGQLKSARQLGLALSQSAANQGAHPLHSLTDGQVAQQHADAMDPAARGRYEGAVQGQPAQKATGRALGEPVERLAQPVIHLDTPASASLVTPASLSLYSGLDTSIVAQGDAHFSAAQSFSGVSGQTSSFYTHAGGIKAIAASGPLSLRAHTDSQQLWADQDITIQSTSDEVRIQAKDSITLTAGQSQVVLKGGDVTFTCPGTWTVKAAGHAWMGGGASSASLMALPDSRVKLFNRQAKLVNELTGEPMAGVPYKASTSEGEVQYGSTDIDGLTMLVATVSPQSIEFHWGVMPPQQGGL